MLETEACFIIYETDNGFEFVKDGSKLLVFDNIDSATRSAKQLETRYGVETRIAVQQVYYSTEDIS